MADRRLANVATPSSNASDTANNVQRSDYVFIDRGGQNFRAKMSGGLFLPAFSAADSGKGFIIDSNGNVIVSNAGAPGTDTAISLGPGEDLADKYRVLIVQVRATASHTFSSSYGGNRTGTATGFIVMPPIASLTMSLPISVVITSGTNSYGNRQTATKTANGTATINSANTTLTSGTFLYGIQ